MAKHNPTIAASFRAAMNQYDIFSEQELMERLNQTIVDVEQDDSYNTKQKLKIYALITSLSNCEVKGRRKFIKKIYRELR